MGDPGLFQDISDLHGVDEREYRLHKHVVGGDAAYDEACDYINLAENVFTSYQQAGVDLHGIDPKSTMVKLRLNCWLLEAENGVSQLALPRLMAVANHSCASNAVMIGLKRIIAVRHIAAAEQIFIPYLPMGGPAGHEQDGAPEAAVQQLDVQMPVRAVPTAREELRSAARTGRGNLRHRARSEAAQGKNARKNRKKREKQRAAKAAAAQQQDDNKDGHGGAAAKA